MSATYNLATAVGQCRLLCTDTDITNPIFSDEEYLAFLIIESDNLKRSAAHALRTIAANEVLVMKRITLLDLSTDGPAEAAALMKIADELLESADADEAGAGAISILPL